MLAFVILPLCITHVAKTADTVHHLRTANMGRIALFFRFTSLIRSPTPPTDDRENSDSTPCDQKVLFVKIGLPKAVTDIPKKVSTFPKKVDSFPDKVN